MKLRPANRKGDLARSGAAAAKIRGRTSTAEPIDYGEHAPRTPKPPRKAAVRRLRQLWREMDELLDDEGLAAALVDELGIEQVEALIDAHESLRGLRVTTRKAGRDSLAPSVEARARRLLKEWPGAVKPWFKRSDRGPLVPGNKFTQWFCEQMQPATVSNCRTLLQKIPSKSRAK